MVHRPVGKARARTVTRGSHTWSYTPKNTVEFEQAIRAAIMEQCPLDDADNIQPLDGPVELSVMIRGDRIKVVVKPLDPKKYATKRPDLDNMIKIFMDAMNGLIYKDDKQVAVVWAARMSE